MSLRCRGGSVRSRGFLDLRAMTWRYSSRRVEIIIRTGRPGSGNFVGADVIVIACRSEVAVYVICELGLLLLIGGAAGTGLGVLASHIYIPTLQIGAEAAARVPPYVVEIAWPAMLRVYALFGLLYLVALIVLVRSLLKMRIFDAIKLGETV